MRSAPSLVWPLGGLLATFLVAATTLAIDGSNEAGPATANGRLADGFDFPVGRPDAVGYHKARGFTPNGHLGEDWNGDGGGDTDLGDPIYVIGHGIVVLARDVRGGWGNVVIVRHAYRDPAEGEAVKMIDSLYGHLDTILVHEGQQVTRGQQIATMGTAHGLYDAHLHFEIRKNITVGMYRSAFARDFTIYHDPTQFLMSHRQLRGGGGGALIAMNTFIPYPGTGGLPATDGAYELGINHSPARLAAVESSKLNKSAYTIRPRATGNTAFDKINNSFQVDRYSDLRKSN